MKINLRVLLCVPVFLMALSGVCRADIATGLVGWWKMDEAASGTCSGAVVLDASGNGSTGNCTNSPTWVAGRIGAGALNFNGTNQYVDVGTPSVLNLGSTNKFTLSCWVYATSNPYGSGVITEMYNPTNVSVMYEIGFSMNDPPASNSILKIGFYGGTWEIATDPAGNIPLNQWIFIAGTWDGTTLVLYKNGVQVATNVPGVSLPTVDYDDVSIGRRHDTAGSVNFFPGYIDDARIYNRPLSAADVAELYNAKSTIMLNHAKLNNFKS